MKRVEIFVNPQVHDVFVDWLLARAEVERFYLQQQKVYLKSHEDFTASEQVTGRKESMVFVLFVEDEAVQTLIGALKQQFSPQIYSCFVSSSQSINEI